VDHIPVLLFETIKGAGIWGDGNFSEKVMPHRILPKGPGGRSLDDKRLNTLLIQINHCLILSLVASSFKHLFTLYILLYIHTDHPREKSGESCCEACKLVTLKMSPQEGKKISRVTLSWWSFSHITLVGAAPCKKGPNFLS